MGEKILGGLYAASDRILYSFNAWGSINMHHLLINTKKEYFTKNHSIDIWVYHDARHDDTIRFVGFWGQ